MKTETINVKELSLSEENEIQFLYPLEPDWKTICDETLVALVKDYVSEPNCATIALGQLEQRGNPLTMPLSEWLLQEEHADEWLKESAQKILDQN